MSLAVFVQVIDPDAFGGRAAFARRAGFVADACRAVAARARRSERASPRRRRRPLPAAPRSTTASRSRQTVLDALAARAARLGVRWPLDATAAR